MSRVPALERFPHPVPGRPRQVTVVLNPTKRAAWSAMDELRTACDQSDWPGPRLSLTSIGETGARQARDAVEDGAEIVVALGGDGTVRSVAHGLVGTGVPLGVVPLGTANLFARNLHLSPTDVRRTVRMALHGAPAEVDLGLAAFREHADADWSAEQPFLVMAGIGHDATTVLETSEELKRRLGWASYLGAGVRHLARGPLPMRVRLDGGEPVDAEVWSLLLGNCGRIPAGIEVFPDALLDDGRLEVLQARVRHLWQWLPVAAQGFARRGVPGSGLQYARAHEVEVQPAEPTAVQLDGDAVGPVAAARFRIAHRGLLVNIDLPRWIPPRRTHQDGTGQR